jgi:hypothetical protein
LNNLGFTYSTVRILLQKFHGYQQKSPQKVLIRLALKQLITTPETVFWISGLGVNEL